MGLDSITGTGGVSPVRGHYDTITDNDEKSIETHGKVASLLGRSLAEVKNDSRVDMVFMSMPESLKRLSSLSPEEAVEGLKKYMADNLLSSITFASIDSQGYISAVNTVHHNEGGNDLLYQQSTLHANSGETDEDMGYLDNADINERFRNAIFSGYKPLNDEDEKNSPLQGNSFNNLVIYSMK